MTPGDEIPGGEPPRIARPSRPRFVVFVTALRAALAFLIGGALLLTPDRGDQALAGFMGIYWLVSGLFSLAWARRGPFLHRLAFAAGIVGVLTGSLVLMRRFGLLDFVPPGLILPTLGVAVILTGILHIIGGFMVGERIDRWPSGHLALGLIELVLGVLLVAGARTGVLVSVATVWAFTGGTILTLDAVRANRRWRLAEA